MVKLKDSIKNHVSRFDLKGSGSIKSLILKLLKRKNKAVFEVLC